MKFLILLCLLATTISASAGLALKITSEGDADKNRALYKVTVTNTGDAKEVVNISLENSYWSKTETKSFTYSSVQIEAGRSWSGRMYVRAGDEPIVSLTEPVTVKSTKSDTTPKATKGSNYVEGHLEHERRKEERKYEILHEGTVREIQAIRGQVVGTWRRQYVDLGGFQQDATMTISPDGSTSSIVIGKKKGYTTAKVNHKGRWEYVGNGRILVTPISFKKSLFSIVPQNPVPAHYEIRGGSLVEVESGAAFAK